MTAEENPVEQNCEALLEEVQRLTWALLDRQASDEEAKELEKLISQDEQSRKVYLECVQLHVDLQGKHAPVPMPGATAKPPSPVLGSLGDSLPGILPAQQRPPV